MNDCPQRWPVERAPSPPGAAGLPDIGVRKLGKQPHGGPESRRTRSGAFYNASARKVMEHGPDEIPHPAV